MRAAAPYQLARKRTMLALVALGLLSSLPMHAESNLRSPWDGQPIKLTDTPYTCPAIVHLSADLTTDRFYSDSKSSIIDPEKWKACVGEENGLHSYADRDYAIKKLANLCVEGLEDNSFFVKATGIPQDTPNGPPAAEQISWAKIYLARFPNAQLAKLLDEAKSMSYMYLGGLPPATLSHG